MAEMTTAVVPAEWESAVIAGDVPGVRHLLEARADPNAKLVSTSSFRGRYRRHERPPLMVAIKSCHRDLAKWLLSNAGSIDLDVNASWLLHEYPDSNDEDGQTALHLCSKAGDAELVALCLSAGADPNLRDRLDATPLHLVGLHPEIVAQLVRARASVAARDRHGQDFIGMLEYAHEGPEWQAVVDALLEAGVDVANFVDDIKAEEKVAAEQPQAFFQFKKQCPKCRGQDFVHENRCLGGSLNGDAYGSTLSTCKTCSWSVDIDWSDKVDPREMLIGHRMPERVLRSGSAQLRTGETAATEISGVPSSTSTCTVS